MFQSLRVIAFPILAFASFYGGIGTAAMYERGLMTRATFDWIEILMLTIVLVCAIGSALAFRR